jgi:hypothetical protein
MGVKKGNEYLKMEEFPLKDRRTSSVNPPVP